VLDLWFERHLEQAFRQEGRPWEEVPDYGSQVLCVHDPDDAAEKLGWMRRQGGMTSFDYETNMLKPDSPDARIVSCSVCWEGKRTIAFPWHGKAKDVMGELLADPSVHKLGWNIKFEERWTRKAFGHGVRGWVHDGMVGAHVLDNRPGITSAKFQAFVQFGQEPWDSEVGQFLGAEGSNLKNNIHKAYLGTLLKYNGIDSLMEWKMDVRQMEDLESEA
jgi:hypothetical protein